MARSKPLISRRRNPRRRHSIANSATGESSIREKNCSSRCRIRVNYPGRWYVRFFFQYLFWSYQWKVQRGESEIITSTEVFDRISSLIDKRNYRMRRLIWGLKSEVADEEPEQRLENYQDILLAWNDNLNSNLALIETHFGQDVKRELESDLSEDFRQIGFGIECEIQKRKIQHLELQKHLGAYINPKCADVKLDDTERLLDRTGYRIYGFNLRLLSKIKEKSGELTAIEWNFP